MAVLFVVLLLTSVALVQVDADVDFSCSDFHRGQSDGDPHPQPMLMLPPPALLQSISIPDIGPDCDVVGVMVTACSKSRVEVNFNRSREQVYVHSRYDNWLPVFLQLTVFCDSNRSTTTDDVMI